MQNVQQLACNDINKLDLGNEAIHRVTCTQFIDIYIDEDLECMECTY